MPYKLSLKNQRLAWGLAAGAAALLLLDALLLEKYFFKTRRFLIGQPQGTTPLRLLLISDLHFKKVLWPYYKRLASKINALQPDLLLITGDILDGHTRMAVVEQFFGLLDSRLPKVAIPGNHDYTDENSLQALAAVLQRHGGSLLINQTKPYTLKGVRLLVTGLDDMVESKACFGRAVKGVGGEPHHVLLIHSPLLQEQVLQELEEINASRPADQQLAISYIFAGHNHGGQVRLLQFAPKLPKKSGNYLRGWYNQQRPYLYLSQGFGTSTLPFRFGARSEITLFLYMA